MECERFEIHVQATQIVSVNSDVFLHSVSGDLKSQRELRNYHIIIV
jgi:hypothetical protein